MPATRVMLVDDEREFVDALARRLAGRGYQTTRAYSGREALERLQADRADVVLLDVRMPGMDGLETLRAVRRAHPLVKVILLSGNASINAAIEGMRLGAVDYLLKPVDFDEMLAKIDAAFEKKRLEEEQSGEGRG